MAHIYITSEQGKRERLSQERQDENGEIASDGYNEDGVSTRESNTIQLYETSRSTDGEMCGPSGGIRDVHE